MENRFIESFYEVILKSVLAGIFIGIGGTAYLSAGGGIIGAVLFTVGLISVVAYETKLFTGTAGFVTSKNWIDLFWIIIGNISGTALIAIIASKSPLEIYYNAREIIDGRLELSWLNLCILGIGCGILMTTAVKFAREKFWIPLLFAVPGFIICGFPHCIADSFYFFAALPSFSNDSFSDVMKFVSDCSAKYPAVVIGNFIGCNVPRFLNWFVSRDIEHLENAGSDKKRSSRKNVKYIKLSEACQNNSDASQ